MKEKYGEQDEEERQMRMALTGSKHVQAFDIQKHAEHKLGSLITMKEDENEEEEADEFKEDQNGKEEANPEEDGQD